MGEPRSYRTSLTGDRFASFVVRHKETDLWIGVDRGSWRPSLPRDILEWVIDLRSRLDRYIQRRPEFLTSFVPVSPDPEAPAVASSMMAASERAGVGPLAAVAGAFSDAVAKSLLGRQGCREVVVENGGDIAFSGADGFTAALLAGASPLSGKVGLRVRGHSYRGLATSAGRVGPSYSAGRADACVVLAEDAVTADAFATAFGNRVGSKADIEPVLALARGTPGVLGLAVVQGAAFGCVGALEVIPLPPEGSRPRECEPSRPFGRSPRADSRGVLYAIKGGLA